MNVGAKIDCIEIRFFDWEPMDWDFDNRLGRFPWFDKLSSLELDLDVEEARAGEKTEEVCDEKIRMLNSIQENNSTAG
jgi:hypothetical protein